MSRRVGVGPFLKDRPVLPCVSVSVPATAGACPVYHPSVGPALAGARMHYLLPPAGLAAATAGVCALVPQTLPSSPSSPARLGLAQSVPYPYPKPVCTGFKTSNVHDWDANRCLHPLIPTPRCVYEVANLCTKQCTTEPARPSPGECALPHCQACALNEGWAGGGRYPLLPPKQ